MRRLLPLLILIVLCSIYSSLLAVAAPSQNVNIKVRASVGGGISDFIVTYVSDRQIDLSWSLVGDATNVMIRAKYGDFPSDIPDTYTDPFDGYLVYYGPASSVSDCLVDLETSSVPVCYRAWAQKPDGNWYTGSLTGSIGGATMVFIALILLALVLTILSWRVKTVLLVLLASVAWAAPTMWILTGSNSSLDSGEPWVQMVSYVLIGMAFVPLIIYMLTENQKDPGQKIWNKMGFTTRSERKEKTKRSQESYKNELRKRLRR